MLNKFLNAEQKLVLKRLLPKAIIALVILAGVFYYIYQKYGSAGANPNSQAQKEAAALLAAVGKIIELPQNEIPAVATVSDKEKLKGQPFFSSAENGDVLFAYSMAKKAVLYRPSANKIINVGPIVNDSQNVGQAPAISPSLRIAYYNGAKINGLAGAAEKTVREKFPNYQTAALGSAANKNYHSALVVDLSKTRGAEAAAIAELLHGTTGNLPAGEARPDADILIIAGK